MKRAREESHGDRAQGQEQVTRVGFTVLPLGDGGPSSPIAVEAKIADDPPVPVRGHPDVLAELHRQLKEGLPIQLELREVVIETVLWPFIDDGRDSARCPDDYVHLMFKSGRFKVRRFHGFRLVTIEPFGPPSPKETENGTRAREAWENLLIKCAVDEVVNEGRSGTRKAAHRRCEGCGWEFASSFAKNCRRCGSDLDFEQQLATARAGRAGASKKK